MKMMMMKVVVKVERSLKMEKNYHQNQTLTIVKMRAKGK